MAGLCSEGQQGLCRQRPVLVENLAFSHNKISPGAQHPCVRLDAPARHRFQIINAQLYGRDLCPLGHHGIRCDRCRSIRQRGQNSAMHHAMNLFVVRFDVEPENRSPLAHAFHVESQHLHRVAFFHPLPNQFRDPFLFFRHFLRHRVSSFSTEPLPIPIFSAIRCSSASLRYPFSSAACYSVCRYLILRFFTSLLHYFSSFLTKN